MISRYTSSEMAHIWSDEYRYQIWLKVELLVCEAWAELGIMPEPDLTKIIPKADFDLKRIAEIEEQVGHDVIAFTRAVSEILSTNGLGEESRWIHYGLTSTDLVDTSLSYILKKVNNILIDSLDNLIKILATRAKEHKYTVMIGRTHGVHAEPTTFGLKMALWYVEMKRNKDRLRRASENICVGKISGAVGTYANIDPFVEEYVCNKLGLNRPLIATQTLQRDRHAEYICTLALTATSLEKFATEIRHLQRSEVREVEEFFKQGQKGSSAMPHKRNPIGCENICGLARVVRGFVTPALENVSLWHERDISHSSVERVVLPDATTLLDYMLRRFTSILTNLQIFPDRMMTNIDQTFGLIYSQQLLLALINKGVKREIAYDHIQSLSQKAWSSKIHLHELALSNTLINNYLSKEEIIECFNHDNHLTYVDYIFNRCGLS